MRLQENSDMFIENGMSTRPNSKQVITMEIVCGSIMFLQSSG